MRPRRLPTVSRSTLPAALACAALLACAPARRRELAAGLAVGGASASGAGAVQVPPPTEDPFFAEVLPLARALDAVPSDIVVSPGELVGGRWTDAEAWVRRDAEATGRKDVRTLYAFAARMHVALPPARAAEEILSAAREEHALDADEFTVLARAPTAGGERRAFSVALLHMGEGPFHEDFRWDLEIARRDRADGSVLLRYERSIARGPGVHVSVFRGAGVLLPEGDGSRWIEAIVVASDVRAPFFLTGKVEGAVLSILGRRWQRLSLPAPPTK